MKNSQKIQLFSRLLKFGCMIGILCSLLSTALFWIYDDLWIRQLVITKQDIEFSTLSLNHLPLHLKIVGFLIDLVQNSFFFAIFLILIKLFQLYEKLQFFTKNTVCYIRQIGYILLFSQLIHPFYIVIRNYILILPRQKLTIPTAHLIEVENLFLAFLIILVAQVIEEGRRLEEEYHGMV